MSEQQLRHAELSELTDNEESIYQMTKDLAGIAKQIKEDTKEDIDPPNPVMSAINKMHESEVNS